MKHWSVLSWCESGSTAVAVSALLFVWGRPRSNLRACYTLTCRWQPALVIFQPSPIRLPSSQAKYNSSPAAVLVVPRSARLSAGLRLLWYVAAWGVSSHSDSSSPDDLMWLHTVNDFFSMTMRGIMGFSEGWSAVVLSSMSSRCHREHFLCDVASLKQSSDMSLLFLWRCK